MRETNFNILVLLLILLFFSHNAESQITANSRRFLISDYYSPNSAGDLEEYKAHGFAQQHTSSSAGRLFFLPILEIDFEKIKFFNENGIPFNPSNYQNEIARSISIPINSVLKLPLETQLPAIASALEQGRQIRTYRRPIVKGTNNTIWMTQEARMTPQLSAMIIESCLEYDKKFNEQKELIKLYSNYKSEIVSLSELEISVFIDQEIIANKKSFGTQVNTDEHLTDIIVVRPSLYHQNKIANGDFILTVSYKFRDANTRTIDARFNVKNIIYNFLEETQKSLQRNSSSGWQVLGFGSRRKKISNSINSTLNTSYSGDKLDDTTIEMFDADESMIAQFENDFFPIIAEQQAINNHINAAQIAAQNRNEQLSNLHLQYATALKNKDPNLETDIAGAVASLAAQDYIGFVAKGVRWGSHNAQATSTFRRVITNEAEIQEKTSWSQMRTMSVQHSIVEEIKPKKNNIINPDLGIAWFIEFNYPIYVVNQFNQHIRTDYKQGIVPSVIQENGAAHKAGIIPGMIISSIGGEEITSKGKLEEILENYNPYENIQLTIREYQGLQSRDRPVTLKLMAGISVMKN